MAFLKDFKYSYTTAQLQSASNLVNLGDVYITNNSIGELLKWNGTFWINNTLAEAGIASASHVHGNATTSTAGFMSATDKTKLDGLSSSSYTLPTATSTTLGGIELFSDTVQSTAANAVTTTASRTYGIQLNSAGQAVVNVPWSDTNTTYSVATTSNTGLMSATDKTKLDGIAVNANNYVLPAATSSALGGVKVSLSGTTLTITTV